MKIKFLTVLSLAVVLLLGACGGKSDADLKTASETALKGEATTSGVTVDVKDGVATISGEVADEAAKTKAAELAKVDGVKSVTNNVTVKVAPPPPAASAEDGPLKTKVEEALKKKKGCETASVEVKDGVATLRGEVAKMAECVMAANEAKPKKVENQLTEKK
jgi:osmotically-inducible protein OsmY